MKNLKNIFYTICSMFFILTLTLSCGDQQSSTNEDIDENAVIEELMAGFADDENPEDETDLDGENHRTHKRHSRAGKKKKI